MAKIIQLQGLDPDSLAPDEALWVYNGLDCAVTANVWNEIQETRTPAADLSYKFVSAMQGPAMEMMLRGIKIDTRLAKRRLWELDKENERIQALLDRFAIAVSGDTLNPQSPQQMQKFFYEILGYPPVKKFDGKLKKMKITTDRDALEKLMVDYMDSRPIIKTILAQKDNRKYAGVLRSGIDPDGRMRTSYNITGTETARWSASKNAFGTGTNLQNITDRLRDIFISDSGYKFTYVDLEQAESRLVAYLSGDEAYIHACESGDLHTTVAKMVWPDLAWTGDAEHDKEVVAEAKCYRDFSFRDLAKRGGHGTNYYGKPHTMAKHLKVDKSIMEEFQQRYFKAFPGIKRWHAETAEQLQTQGWIETPLGRVRYFFGRRSDDATLREAIAFVPQSVIGELLNLGLWRVWKYLGINRKPDDPMRIITTAQLHDAGLFQYLEAVEDRAISEITKLMTVGAEIRGRKMIIPCSAAVGWNWRKYNDGIKQPQLRNLDGLKKWTGSDPRVRTSDTDTSLLGRVF